MTFSRFQQRALLDHPRAIPSFCVKAVSRRESYCNNICFTAAVIPGSALAQARREEHRPEYHFRKEDSPKLREQYKEIDKVDRGHREHFVVGGRLPGDWRHHIRPVPVEVIHELPPIPAGYEVGYCDGYAVVYDPATGYILEVLDLL